jgi:hypothetical protein
MSDDLGRLNDALEGRYLPQRLLGGEPRVLVRTCPDPAAGRWEVSLGPGTEPVWAPDGTSLYYWSDDTLVAARLGAGGDFEMLDRESLFVDPGYVGNRLWANCDTHPDGDRFVMVRNTADGTDSDMILVRSFLRDVRDRTRPDQR